MNSIKIESAEVVGNRIKYFLKDDTEQKLLSASKVEAWIQYHHIEEFGIDLKDVPESIVYIPIFLYLLPVTYFYKVTLDVPSLDEDLYNNLENIYDSYSKVYGPFDNAWRGRIKVGRIEKNSALEAKFEKIVFFSGGIDACSAGINNADKKSVLVSIPSIEYNSKNEGALRDEKFILIKDFSNVVEKPWIVILNNFNNELFKNSEIQHYLQDKLCLNSVAFKFDGWFGIKYIANMCCVVPFSYLLGIRKNGLVMGSGYEQIEERRNVNEDGANPTLSDSFSFCDMSFSEQDQLLTRRSVKTKSIIDWCNKRNKYPRIWTCFSDNSSQCGRCIKCVRTQLNIIAIGENPKYWGFENFDEKDFSDYVCTYNYVDNACWLWDIIDSIDNNVIYPYCDELLHFLKNVGYRKYLKRAKFNLKWQKLSRLFKIHKYPHYVYIFFRILHERKMTKS